MDNYAPFASSVLADDKCAIGDLVSCIAFVCSTYVHLVLRYRAAIGF